MPGARTDPLTAYEALIEHAELELELAGLGDLDGLVALAGRWEALTETMEPVPPPAAAPLLERAVLMHERTRIELIRLRESLMVDLATATQAKRTADGYAGQLPGRPRIDRTA